MSASPSHVEEFLELCTPHQRRLYTYIVLMVGDTTAAHDILQDTNLVLWQKFDQFQPGTNFFAFAKEVARYRVLRYRQIHARDAVLLEPETLELLDEIAVRDGAGAGRRISTSAGRLPRQAEFVGRGADPPAL